MNFRLNFHLSAPTTLETYEILANIQFKLKDKKYISKYLTDRSVSFYDNPWRMRWNTDAYMIDGGEFIISDDLDNGRLLKLNYYWRYASFLIRFLVISTIFIVSGQYSMMWFFGAFFAIFVPIDILRSKMRARALLAEVLTKFV